MRVAATIEHKLTGALSPTRLQIIDESHRHQGHAGSRPEGESHFKVEVVSESFAGKSRVERQQMVYRALADEIKTDIHALSLRTLTPQEDIGT